MRAWMPHGHKFQGSTSPLLLAPSPRWCSTIYSPAKSFSPSPLVPSQLHLLDGLLMQNLRANQKAAWCWDSWLIFKLKLGLGPRRTTDNERRGESIYPASVRVCQMRMQMRFSRLLLFPQKISAPLWAANATNYIWKECKQHSLPAKLLPGKRENFFFSQANNNKCIINVAVIIHG